MAADRLDAIRKYVQDYAGLMSAEGLSHLVSYLRWLLTEVDRLRAELDQSRTYQITGGDRG